MELVVDNKYLSSIRRVTQLRDHLNQLYTVMLKLPKRYDLCFVRVLKRMGPCENEYLALCGVSIIFRLQCYK